MLKGRFDLRMGEYEYFRGRDWVKPTLYPPPYGGEKGRGADDLDIL